jgi:F-box domain
MTTTFLDLPAEVIILFLCYLPLRELVACKRLCRHLHALIKHSQLLQYHFRIMCSDVEDLFVPGICSSKFLKSLEHWEMAWWDLDIGEPFARHRYHNVLWTVEHVVQNGYIAAMHLGDSTWHTAPGWSYANISHILWQGDEGPQGSWKDIQLDRSITPKGYVLDVNQDLVAVVFWSVSLNSHSDMLNFPL